MVRITQSQVFNTLLKETQKNSVKMSAIQNQLSTGKKVTKASDDSVSFTTSKLIEEEIRKNDQYKKNVESGLAKARSAQDALDGMIDVLIDFKEVTINGANETLSIDERTLLAKEVDSLKQSILDLANSDFNQTFLFGGTNTQSNPFFEDNAAIGGIADNSNASPLTVQISDNSMINVSISGDKLRNTPAGDLFELFTQVEDDLSNDDTNAINASLDNIDGAINHITGLATEHGNNINRMAHVNEQLEVENIDQKGEVSRLTDTNFAEAITGFQSAQTSFNAALAVQSQISQSSLLDFLR